MFKRLVCIFLVLLLLLCTGISAFAKDITSSSYNGYQYNSDNTSTAAPVGYVADGIISGRDMSLAFPFGNNLSFWSDESNVEESKFILYDDGKILVTDIDLNVISIFDSFCDLDGNETTLSDVVSVAADFKNGNLYVADSKSALKVYDFTGRLVGEITAEGGFAPSKLLFVQDTLFILDSDKKGYYTAYAG